MDKGVEAVADAILGVDAVRITVGGREYDLFPPTIAKIAGAGRHLANVPIGGGVLEMLAALPEAAEALSWFIAGDASLSPDLVLGTVAEITDGLRRAVEMIGMGNFQMLSALSKSVRTLIANTKS